MTFVSGRGLPPVAGETQTCGCPAAAASERNAIDVPSGENTGSTSRRGFPSDAAESRRGAPDESSATEIAPSRSRPSLSSTFCDQAARRPSGEIDASWKPRTFWSEAKTVSIEGCAAEEALALVASRSAVAARREPTTSDLPLRPHVRSTQMLLTCVYSSSA